MDHQPRRRGRGSAAGSGASTTADQLAWCHLQELAIVADPYFFDGDYYSHSVGPVRGMGLAVALALVVTYAGALVFGGGHVVLPLPNNRPKRGSRLIPPCKRCSSSSGPP